MRLHDLSCELALVNHSLSDPTTTTMPSTTTTDPQQETSSSPIHSGNNEDPESKNPENTENIEGNSKKSKKFEESSKNNGKSNSNNAVVRRERPSRACTQRAVQRMQQAAAAEAALAAMEKKKKAVKRRERLARLLKEVEVEEGEEEEEERSRGSDEEEEDGEASLSSSRQHCSSKVITPLVGEPEPSQLPRWNIRSMWQLASILNFLNVFRPLLNIKVEFSAEEFETALLTPNNTLGEIHMPLLKAIPPITRVALGQNTWITVLCRKLRDWWHWVADGELPIVASHGAEIEAYNQLDPGVRVVILKALCDIRVEQEDIRSYIDDSIKHGVHLSTFRKERIGGDSHGVSYWYEDDPVIGHRLYREIRKIQVKRGKGKNVPPIPNSSYQWETVGTNFDEIQEVSEKLFSSKNRTEASLGKKLKNDMLPEIEKVHKRKEKLLKKQHRQALLLDSMIVDGLGGGRSLRDRKPVTYTFDDFDRSINEAIKDTKKKQMSPDPTVSRDFIRHEVATNGRGGGPSQFSLRSSFSRHSSKSPDHDEFGDDQFDTLDRSNRRRQRPQRYSVRDFVDAVSDNDGDFDDSDDDVVGEVVYDDEYLRQKRRRKTSSSSEGDQEYQWDDENTEDEEEEEEEDDSLSASEESDQSRKFKKLPGRTRRETKLRSVGEIQSGLRRSKRATRNRINYQQYEWSESENELTKPEKSNGSHEYSHASDNADSSTESQDFDENHENMDMDMKVVETVEEHPETPKEEQDHPPEKSSSPGQNEVGVKKRQFLDLNELAPGSGFDDGPNSMKDEDTDDF